MADTVTCGPEWAKAKAEARREILAALESQCTISAQRRAKAIEVFIDRYNAGNEHIGVSRETFETVPKITQSTLYRWRKEYKKRGVAGLVGSKKRGKPSSKITSEMENFIVGHLGQSPDRRPRRIYEYLVSKFSGPRVSLPCEQTVRNYINAWKTANRPVYTYLQNPEKWKGNYQAAFGDASEKARHFLHFVEFDGTPADVICSDKSRYKLAAGVDVFSRKAKVIVSPTSNSAATAGLFRQIILDWGLFDVAVMDNGRDYTSLHIEAICESLSIKRLYLPYRTPEGKPHVERFFRNLSTGLFEELEGFCGHNVAERKAIESRKSVTARLFTPGESIAVSMTREELQKAIDDWLENIYHQRPNSETGKSPNQRAGESTKPIKRLPAEQEAALDILLCPVGQRTVSKKGIRLDGGRYIAPELSPWIGHEVQVRRDLTDIGHVWAFDLDGKFICKAWDARLKGITAEEAKEARKLQARETRERAKALKVQAKALEPSPMLRLMEEKSRESGKIKPFRRSVEYESENLREAMRAAGAEMVAPENIATVGHTGGTPVFESALSRYKYILEEMKTRALTQREEAFKAEFEQTPEYRMVFGYYEKVMSGGNAG